MNTLVTLTCITSGVIVYAKYKEFESVIRQTYLKHYEKM